MNLTEEEAKTKWCHLAMGDDDSAQKCVASACMAWRWNGERRSPEFIDSSNADICPDGEGWRENPEYIGAVLAGTKPNHFTKWIKHRLTPTGHCGLAGKL